MNHHSDTLLQKWSKLTLAEQLGNVGSEVSRMIKWRNCNPDIAERAFERMLDLLNATITCQIGKHRLRELTRVRELINTDWCSNESSNYSSLDGFNQYFTQFAALANKDK